MYAVYILYSKNFDKYYIGSTNSLPARLKRHNGGHSKYTKPYRPWLLVYFEKYPSRPEAVQREKYLKSLKDKEIIRALVDNKRIPV